MKEYRELLRILVKRSDVERIDRHSDLDINVAQQLYDRGFIAAELDKTWGGPGLINPKITLAGKEWLSHQEDKNRWWNSFDKRVAILGLVVALITLFLAVK